MEKLLYTAIHISDNMSRTYLCRLILLLFAIFAFSFFVSANNIMTVEADIYKFPDMVSINVPDYFYIGNATVGFQTDPSSKDKIYINNTGTKNATVSIQLLSPNDIISRNLFFTRRLSGVDYGYFRANEFTLDIPWSGEVGKSESDYFYMKLDLRNESNIQSDLIGHTTDVKFIAVAQ